MTTVSIIDYNLGNLFNVKRAFEAIGANAVLTQSPLEIQDATILVLPGVGAFADGMGHLRSLGFIEPIMRYAASGKPLLGICLGMQMLFSWSTEFGKHQGLGLIDGTIDEIPGVDTEGQILRRPHIGWNELRPTSGGGGWGGTLLGTTKPGAAVYFVHSLGIAAKDCPSTLAFTNYGGHLISAVVKQANIFGCQFHPERSGVVGLEILKQFVTLYSS